MINKIILFNYFKEFGETSVFINSVQHRSIMEKTVSKPSKPSKK